MRSSKTSLPRLLLALLAVSALVGAGLATIASGAGPYSNLAKFLGNKTACGTTQATGCTFNGKTVTALQFRVTITGSGEARTECQVSLKGAGWNPGGSPPVQNDSISFLELTKCVVHGFEACKVTPEVSGLPWATMATTDGKGNFADQITIPKGGLKFKLSGTCPVKAGTYEFSGQVNAETTNTSEGEPECEPVTYAHCTYDEFEQASGKLVVTSEGKEVGSALVIGEIFFYCTGGGACTEKQNQIALE